MEELKTIGGLAQLGSFGLLCAIAYWLMKNIPQHFEGLKNERLAAQQAVIRVAEEHTKANVAMGVEHRASIKEIIAQTEEHTRYERAECERRHQEMIALQTKAYEVMRQMKHEVANIAQARAMEKAAREAKEKKEGT